MTLPGQMGLPGIAPDIPVPYAVTIRKVQKKDRWRVLWTFDGERFERCFPTHREAMRHRRLLRRGEANPRHGRTR